MYATVTNGRFGPGRGQAGVVKKVVEVDIHAARIHGRFRPNQGIGRRYPTLQ